MSASITELKAERDRLDRQLDEAVARYALFEQDINIRMKNASPDEMALLMEERARVEDMLGITELVERLDALRACMAILQGQAPVRMAG